METETKNSLVIFLLLLALTIGLALVGLQLKQDVEKRDGVAKPTTKMMAKPAEAKTDSADVAKLSNHPLN